MNLPGVNLRILTPDKVIIDQPVEKVIVRTIEGDIGILKNHINYISAIKNGPVTIFHLDGKKESLILNDGFVSVMDGKVDIVVFNSIKFNQKTK